MRETKITCDVCNETLDEMLSSRLEMQRRYSNRILVSDAGYRLKLDRYELPDVCPECFKQIRKALEAMKRNAQTPPDASQY